MRAKLEKIVKNHKNVFCGVGSWFPIGPPRDSMLEDLIGQTFKPKFDSIDLVPFELLK
jgi:hypothetical protein